MKPSCYPPEAKSGHGSFHPANVGVQRRATRVRCNAGLGPGHPEMMEIAEKLLFVLRGDDY